ncbi:MAG TPA: hypothetical protein VEQ59_16330 [Polyangiaceae bacterium]|nr:hypothetical protein [Polyangiaceae bacterium]
MHRFSKVSAAIAGLSLVAACSSAAPAELSVSVVSDKGLVDADVRVASPVERGENDVFVELRPHRGDGEPQLLALRATMAAHGHEARAGVIEHTAAGYHAADLDLFMTGRWLLELDLLAVDGEPDSVSLPVDVP